MEELKNSIDLMDSQITIQYGAGAQRNISDFSDNILAQVRSKDSGYVGELMSELVLKVRDVGVDQLDDGILEKIPFLKNASRTVKKFMQRYEKLEVQIDHIEQELEKARMQMLKDITMFDGLYEKNMEYFGSCRSILRPRRKAERVGGGPPFRSCARRHPQKAILLSAQVVRDFEDTVNRFEKKIHDLKLSKTIAIQTRRRFGSFRTTTKYWWIRFRQPCLTPYPSGKTKS